MASKAPDLKRFYLLLGGLAVIGGGALAWMVLRPASAVSIPVNVTVQASDTSGFSGYYLGADSAPVTITEYADYQCPACGQFETLQFPTIKRQLIETGKVRWRYRDFPLDQIHPLARVAAHAGACADEQGQFWPMHDVIYEQQAAWSGSSRGASMFRDYAERIGLDLGRYDECMRSVRYAGRIQAAAEEGVRLGVNSTPSIIVGGRIYGYLGSDQLKSLVDSLIAAGATTP